MRKQIEDEIIDRLKTIPNVWVGAFPVNPNNYVLTSNGTDIMVRYSAYKPVNSSVRKSTAFGNIEIDVIFISYDLRGAYGIYYALENAINQLQTFLIQNYGILELTDERFLNEENGLWQFGQKWKIETNSSLTNNVTDEWLTQLD